MSYDHDNYDGKSETTIQNEKIIIFCFIFFLFWILIPCFNSIVKVLKELNDSYHYETRPTFQDEIQEMNEKLNDIIHLNRHRYQDFKAMNSIHQKEIDIIYKKISSLEEKFHVLTHAFTEIDSVLDKLKPKVASCKGGYEVVS